MTVFCRMLTFCFALLLITATVIAKSGKGTLSGTLSDASGASIAGAKVSARNMQTGMTWTFVTTNAGLYAFSTLDPGTYTVTVEQAGFKILSKANIVVSFSNQTNANIRLVIGDVSQTVTITDKTPPLQTVTSDIGASFALKLIQPFIDGAKATNPESGGVAFNGLTSVASLGEFRHINNTFTAEYGRKGGGGESFVTKLGGSQFHRSSHNFHLSSVLSEASWAGRAGSTAANPMFRKTPFHTTTTAPSSVGQSIC